MMLPFPNPGVNPPLLLPLFSSFDHVVCLHFLSLIPSLSSPPLLLPLFLLHFSPLLPLAVSPLPPHCGIQSPPLSPPLSLFIHISSFQPPFFSIILPSDWRILPETLETTARKISGDVNFINREALQQAINDVRSNSSPNTWVVFGSTDQTSNDIALRGTGTGGVSDFSSLLRADGADYVLVKYKDMVDGNETYKYAFIYWVGDSVKALRKAVITQWKEKVAKFTGYYTVDIQTSDLSDLSDEALLDAIQAASGTKLHVKEASAPAAAPLGNRTVMARKPMTEQLKKTAVSNKGSAVALEDEGAIHSAIQAIRPLDAPNDWVLVEYTPDFSGLRLAGSGSGGLEGLKGNLKSDNAYYGLVRVSDTSTGGQVTQPRYCYVVFVGDDVKPMKKAKISTQRGAIDPVFEPKSFELYASSVGELREQDVAKHLSRLRVNN